VYTSISHLKNNPSTAIISEHTQSFGLGCSSVGVEHYTRCAEALINKVYKVYKDKAFSQELRLLACS